MKLINIFLLLLISAAAWSQHEADNWYFGNQSGITFSTIPPSFLPGSQMYAGEGCASLSDHNGNLLFYSDGVFVWSRNHTLMPNGNGLNGSSTCSQSALFVPYPGMDSLYYIFTPPDEFTNASFCYSVIDLTLNNGFGDVINKNTPLFSPSTEKVTAVSHANGTDIWVIGHSFNNSDFYAYLITTAGINSTPVISSAGTVNGGGIENNIGIMKASSCGDKIALTVGLLFVELFDFDNSTGIVSNAIHLGNFAPNAWGLYGTEFSPDGSRLYITQEHAALLVQYNLLAGSAAAIIASADTIVYMTTEYFGTLQNGPDGKTYISRFNTNGIFFLACINNPDSLGSACNFLDSAVTLNVASSHGLPNFMTAYFCNLNTGVTNIDFTRSDFSVFPNPARDFATLRYNLSSSQPTIISLYNLYGQKLITILNEKQPAGEHQVKIELKGVAAGIYFVKINYEGKEEVRKMVVE